MSLMRYFTRDLSAAGLQKIYKKVSGVLHGKVAIKLHTGEQHGPNIIPRPWVKNLFEKEMGIFDDATIIETNTYYEGDRDTTEKHRKTLEVNGWTFADVDITDEFGTTTLPVKDGKWFTEMSVGKSLPTYDSFLALTHFKGRPTLKAMFRAASAAPTRTSASAAQTAKRAKNGSIQLIPEISGASARKS